MNKKSTLRTTAMIDVNGLADIIVNRMRKYRGRYSYDEIAEIYETEFLKMLNDIIDDELTEDVYEIIEDKYEMIGE